MVGGLAGRRGGILRSAAELGHGSTASVSVGGRSWVLCDVVLRRFDLCENVFAQMGFIWLARGAGHGRGHRSFYRGIVVLHSVEPMMS